MRLTFLKYAFLFMVIATVLSGCYRMRASKGGGQIKPINERQIDAADVAIPEGYQIELIAKGLNYPTGIDFDESGTPYIIESGYAYGEEWTVPTLKKIEDDGSVTVIAKGEKNGPWNGVSFYDGKFYIAEGGQLEGGKLLEVTKAGEIKPILEDLPSFGDHHTNGPVIRSGYIYFGQGTATNSGVVGNDNHDYGWLKRHPSFHDIPCKDIILTGENYTVDNVLTEHADDKTTTGAFVPYGQKTAANQRIEGSIPCSGAILRMPITGGALELVAWGLRNPYGLAFSPQGKLFVADNAYDVRGSRPVWGAGDVLWEIENGKWYGWPDFSAETSIANEGFAAPGEKEVKALLAQYPNEPPRPIAVLGVHSSSNGLDFSRNAAFGYEGQVFVAQFGDMSPTVGKVMSPVGFKVVRVDVETGVIHDFAVNKGKRNGPASWLEKGGLERPIAVRFDPNGNALYVVDFGIMQMDKDGSKPLGNTGAVWKITRKK